MSYNIYKGNKMPTHSNKYYEECEEREKIISELIQSSLPTMQFVDILELLFNTLEGQGLPDEAKISVFKIHVKMKRYRVENKISKTCLKCDKKKFHSEKYDTLYCSYCNEWTEAKCEYETCNQCLQRPETPIDGARLVDFIKDGKDYCHIKPYDETPLELNEYGFPKETIQ